MGAIDVDPVNPAVPGLLFAFICRGDVVPAAEPPTVAPMLEEEVAAMTAMAMAASFSAIATALAEIAETWPWAASERTQNL